MKEMKFLLIKNSHRYLEQRERNTIPIDQVEKYWDKISMLKA